MAHAAEVAAAAGRALASGGGFNGAASAAAAVTAASAVAGAELPLRGVLLGLVAAAANAGAFVTVGQIGPAVSPLCCTYW